MEHLKKKFHTQDLVEALKSKIFCYHDMLKEFIWNRGPQFEFNYFIELHQAFGVHLSLLWAFKQLTNGSAEWLIKTIARVLRAYVNIKQTHRVSQLRRAEYTYNNSENAAYKVTPIDVCQEPVTNLHQYYQSKWDADNSYLTMLEFGHEIFRDYLITVYYKQLENAQKRPHENIILKVGDLVMYQRRSWK